MTFPVAVTEAFRTRWFSRPNAPARYRVRLIAAVGVALALVVPVGGSI